MKRIPTSRRRASESGQAAAVVLIVLAVFLLGVLGLVTDYAQIWAHRQMAQSAADAACQAGAGDLFLNYENASGASGSYGLDFSWIGKAFTCSSSSGNSVCTYASINGNPGNSVSATFPSSFAGGPPLTGFGVIANPYIKVDVTENVPFTFSRFLHSQASFPVHAAATCGISPVTVPVPVVVLNKTAAQTLSLNGNPLISIIGGPLRSIQIDSSNAGAFSGGGTSLVDLHLAGPMGTGGDIGVFGTEPQPSSKNFNPGTGKWVSPAFPYGDPWASIAAPSAPATTGSVTSVGYGENGCPDPAGCVEFSPGNYVGCKSSGSLTSGGNGCLAIPIKYNINFGVWTKNTTYTKGTAIRPGGSSGFVYVATNSGTSGGTTPVWPQTRDLTLTDGTVIWKNVGNPTSTNTAIFDPGLYYVGSEGLQLNSNSTVRPSTATGDGSYGTTFYFSTGGSTELSVASNSGSSSNCASVTNSTGLNPTGSPSNCVIPYILDGTGNAATGSVLSQPLRCPKGAANPAQLTSSVSGNILMGPCTGTLAGVSTDGLQYRGFLFFQNRSSVGTANWGGGGQFLLSGFLYFHDSTYSSVMTLSGNSGSGAYALGSFVADKVALGGASGMTMILNPSTNYQILRPTLLE
jgi:hypothetical protein